MTLPDSVRLVEVGPRDGLQNEKQAIDTQTKVELVNSLAAAGLRNIETGSFVNPKWVPQMADSEAVFTAIDRRDDVCYSALTPNVKGLDRALEAGATEVAVFIAASESFSQKNINCSIAESLQRSQELLDAARAASVPVRGYVSCVVGCPYEGAIAPESVARVSEALLELGCYEISLGDTIGVGTPASVNAMLDAVLDRVPVDKIAAHFHDTYGQGIANIYAALLRGVAVVDSSIAGLGGCPYADGASGNVATEDVVFLLDGLGIAHDADLDALVRVGTRISQQLARSNGSKVGLARAKALGL